LDFNVKIAIFDFHQQKFFPKEEIMKKLILYAVLILCFFSIAQGADKNYYAKYLLPSEVEKVTGLKGIKADHKYSLNFLTEKGEKLLLVRFSRSKSFERETKRKKLWTVVKGIGDKAKIAIPQMPYMIVFTRGTHMVNVISHVDSKTGKPYLSVPQLKKICKMIETKIDPKKNYL
jgi:hypothetical protein